MNKVKILNLVQGSEEWKKARAEYYCASDSPAVMGASKYKSRNKLMLEKKTGRVEEVDSFTQQRFDDGHATEELAREIIELNLCESFTPIVGSREIDGMLFLASLDGLSEDGKTIFEHKLFNQVLAENVRNNVLEPSHYWQLEEQLMVFGADNVLFVCSDGTEEKMESMEYVSVPSRKKELIAGWKQFGKDLAVFEPQVKQEAVVATEAEAFPMVVCSVEGLNVVSNLPAMLIKYKDRAEVEMNRVLETDQDFADKEDLNKKTVKARADLKTKVASIQGQFISLADFSDIALQIDSVLQKMQSQGEKQVKQAKEEKKRGIENKGRNGLTNYVLACDDKITPLTLNVICGSFMPDFVAAMKGKRNLESLQSAVDDVVAKQKIEINAVMSRIVPNQIFMREHGAEFKFLFADVAQIINQDTEPFQAVVKSRIADHKEKEQKKDDDRREEIRIEEEEKATKKAAKELAAKTPPKVEPDLVEVKKSDDDLSRPFEAPAPEQKITGVDISSGPDKTVYSDPFVNAIMEWQKVWNVADNAVDALISILADFDK
jgi:predicted phage-related endonuclease